MPRSCWKHNSYRLFRMGLMCTNCAIKKKLHFSPFSLLLISWKIITVIWVGKKLARARKWEKWQGLLHRLHWELIMKIWSIQQRPTYLKALNRLYLGSNRCQFVKQFVCTICTLRSPNYFSLQLCTFYFNFTMCLGTHLTFNDKHNLLFFSMRKFPWTTLKKIIIQVSNLNFQFNAHVAWFFIVFHTHKFSFLQ